MHVTTLTNQQYPWQDILKLSYKLQRNHYWFLMSWNVILQITEHDWLNSQGSSSSLLQNQLPRQFFQIAIKPLTNLCVQLPQVDLHILNYPTIPTLVQQARLDATHLGVGTPDPRANVQNFDRSDCALGQRVLVNQLTREFIYILFIN